MKFKNKISLLVLSTFSFTVASAQTVNTGEVHVSENTVMSIVEDFNNTDTGTLQNNGDIYAYSSWNNDNVIDFDPSIIGTTNGLTRFVGSTAQNITGSQFSMLNNVLFDNTSDLVPFQLSGLVSVATQSNFTNGIVDVDNFGGVFVFEDNANHINTSDNSHIDGFTVKTGDDAFTFPIGDSNFYRFSGISSPVNTSDEFESKYFFEDTNLNYPTDNLGSDLAIIDESEHWEINRIAGNSDVLVTLSWSDVTTPDEILAEPLTDIVIARWDAAQNIWVNEGGVVNTVNQTVTTSVDVSEFGVFTLARTQMGEVLPCGFRIENTLITPNGDGLNDFFNINFQDLSCVNNINVQIFNRWGVKVFESDNYGSGGDVFDATSDGRSTINQSNKLPTGTYYYVVSINYNTTNGTDMYKETDYLYVNGD